MVTHDTNRRTAAEQMVTHRTILLFKVGHMLIHCTNLWSVVSRRCDFVLIQCVIGDLNLYRLIVPDPIFHSEALRAALKEKAHGSGRGNVPASKKPGSPLMRTPTAGKLVKRGSSQEYRSERGVLRPFRGSSGCEL